MSPEPLILAVVGATGTGKSDLGVRLALEIGGEVVNADAMQLYRGMDIGTAKLPIDERRGVPHHQLDVLDVRDEARVATYQERGRHPILVGGSGLYVRAAVDHLEIPPTDPAVRAHWEAYADRLGAQAAYDELVPQFEALFARSGQDWPSFCDAVRRLAALPPDVRRAALARAAE